VAARPRPIYKRGVLSPSQDEGRIVSNNGPVSREPAYAGSRTQAERS